MKKRIWKTRQAAEAAIRHSSEGPKFYCRYCERQGQSLQHLTICARKHRESGFAK